MHERIRQHYYRYNDIVSIQREKPNRLTLMRQLRMRARTGSVLGLRSVARRAFDGCTKTLSDRRDRSRPCPQ
jgi:hypothetical protein